VVTAPDPRDVIRRWIDAYNERRDGDLVGLAHPDVVLRPPARTANAAASPTRSSADKVPTTRWPKRFQRWRSIEAWRHGRAASFNVAPPAWTVSVTKHQMLAAGYHGAKSVGMEVFEPQTMRTVMAALIAPRPPQPTGSHPPGPPYRARCRARRPLATSLRHPLDADLHGHPGLSQGVRTAAAGTLTARAATRWLAWSVSTSPPLKRGVWRLPAAAALERRLPGS
jgi:hypothetical protein